MAPALLSPESVENALSELPEWSLDGDALRRNFTLSDFDAAMALINAVADVARAQDHHPNLENVYNEVTLRVTTHDAGGITARDVSFAKAVSALAEGSG